MTPPTPSDDREALAEIIAEKVDCQVTYSGFYANGVEVGNSGDVADAIIAAGFSRSIKPDGCYVVDGKMVYSGGPRVCPKCQCESQPFTFAVSGERADDATIAANRDRLIANGAKFGTDADMVYDDAPPGAAAEGAPAYIDWERETEKVSRHLHAIREQTEPPFDDASPSEHVIRYMFRIVAERDEAREDLARANQMHEKEMVDALAGTDQSLDTLSRVERERDSLLAARADGITGWAAAAERYAALRTAREEIDRLSAALAELVACDDLGNTVATLGSTDDYARRIPLAWAAARAALGGKA